ncbi:MAG TPA: M28 family peptidase [Tahibacter sp.]|uniref:M28 family peptidase n=1 Tax=Tahibacter sp. TaxID=2056211 RepID=UPI002BF45CEB|nr:M28 family peptidase [Tahibacter sp.]HSX58786.1 M28 family peptidase [Tahibacter sp.]
MVVVCAALLGFVMQPFVAPLPSQPPAVEPAALERHVRVLSVDLFPRSYDQPERIEAAARYVERTFADAGVATESQAVEVDGMTYRNVIARFGPREGPLLVIGAHYDSHADVARGVGEAGFSPQTHTPGADDNASGVAVLLELARLLATHPPPRPVELVAYTLEEPPHFRSSDMGSARHAHALREAGRDIELMLSLETLGHFDDAPGSQAYPIPAMRWLYGDRADFIAVVGRLGGFAATRRVKASLLGASDLPVRSINAPALLPGIDFSDHLSYWDEGFPALMITDTAFLRSANYHGAGDTAEKLDYARMAKIVQGVYAITRQAPAR